jgi:hypothetical protein
MRVLVGLGGLVGLLIVVFFIVWLQAESASTVIPAGNIAHKEAEKIAGRDANGAPVSKSITLETVSNGGRPAALLVKDIEANGPLATYFGLQVGDQIIQVGALQVSDGPEVANSEMTNAYRQQWPLVIIRNGQKMTLPAPTAPSANSNQQPSATPGTPKDTRSPLQRQLDAIKNIPTH